MSSSPSPDEPQWRPVSPGPLPELDPETDAAPSPPRRAGREKPPVPAGVKIGGFVLGIGLIGLAAWVGITLGEEPETPAPLWALEAPSQVGNYIVGGTIESPVPTDEGRSIVRATYADGASQVVLLMSRPETDLTEYLTNAGVENAAAVDIPEETESTEGAEPAESPDMCGTSVDTGLNVCARMVDETGILMVGLTSQSIETLAPLLNDFVDVLRTETPAQAPSASPSPVPAETPSLSPPASSPEPSPTSPTTPST